MALLTIRMVTFAGNMRQAKTLLQALKAVLFLDPVDVTSS